MAEPQSLAALLSTREVVVFCGSGGVGKTSTAAAAALTAAARLGGKVLVLTIDPAKRLADALGLEAFGNVARRVPLDAYAELGVEPRGELWAAMLDTKRSWDELVLRHAPDEATAYRILDNRMYHNVTSRFVQSHDYIAMERLYEVHASGEYDLIVIDTPPTRNAIDFLEAPARMADFFGGRLLRWLTMPYRIGSGRGGRMFNAASKPFYQMADRVLGSQFLQDIAEFFLNFQSMYGGFVERAEAVEQLLHDRRTTFAVVTTLEGAPLREAESFCRELSARNFDLGALVLNKVLPDYLLSTDGEHAADVFSHESDAIAEELVASGVSGLDDATSTARVLRTLADSFLNYEVVARREAELRTELTRLAPPGPEVIVSVPAFPADIDDARALARIGEALFATGTPDTIAPVTTFFEQARTKTALWGESLRHVQRLAASWQALSDLCFSDLLLLAPVVGEDGSRSVVLAQVRPTTGQTVYPMDLVGAVVDEVARPLVARAFRNGEVVEGDSPLLGSSERAHVQCIPVRHAGSVIAVVTRDTRPTLGRNLGELEQFYLSTFERFAAMIAEGSFPFRQDDDEFEDAPRVADGMLLLDPGLRVRFASPNAVSSMHRLGIHSYTSGLHLAEMGFDQDAVDVAIRARLPVTEEVERGETSLLLQAIPQLSDDKVVGVCVLVRDVTDLRRRDRLLLSKDATIREIHHRVKNNLQTIAALLRLQGRRLQSPEAQEAIEESERRIRSIAIVHETLSREPGDEVRFDDIVQPLVRVVAETVTGPDRDLRLAVEGDAGMLPGDLATPLAVVLNELMQNAVDHAFPVDAGRTTGTITVQLARSDGQLEVDVVDDGVGLPPGFTVEQSGGLGLSIVQALVTSELGGTIELRSDAGTRVHLTVPLHRPT